MISVSCYIIPINNLKVGYFKDENSAKLWIVNTLNDANYLNELWTGKINIVGIENIHKEFIQLTMNEIIRGLEAPGDIKIKVLYYIQDEL